ncbi:hypothetical protein JOD03_001405 [Chryseomicrobium aureum]|nr:hypothetical protein [Chryseomicrobium aureum]
MRKSMKYLISFVILGCIFAGGYSEGIRICLIEIYQLNLL